MNWEAVLIVPLIGGLCSMLARFIETQLRSRGVFPDPNVSEFTEVPDDQLPRCLRHSRTRRDAQLRQAGFSKCGNQLCKHRGMESYTSHYLSADGQTLLLDCATRTLLRGYPSKFSTALRSICADGHMIETSTHNRLPRTFVNMPDEAMFTVAVVGSDELHLLADEHQKRVTERLESGNSERIPIDPSRIREVETYGLLLVDWQLFRSKQASKPADTASDYFRNAVLGLAEAV